MAGPRDVVVRDLQDLIFTLTQDAWQPTEAKYRITVAYRGLSSSAHGLETSLSRLRGRSSAELEGHLLRNFRKYAHRDAAPGDSVWNWLSLAQHHGLPTRLLDWTFSPYVALHFATSDPRSYSVPGAIWCVDYVAAHRALPDGLRDEVKDVGFGLFTTEILDAAAPTLEEFDRFHDEHGDPLPVFFEPPSLDERIINQSAVFSTMTSPRVSIGQWLEEHPEVCRKVVIPAELKWAIRNHLDQANVTERVLFPGLDGLSRWLRRYYGDRPESVYPPSPSSPAEPSGAAEPPAP